MSDREFEQAFEAWKKEVGLNAMVECCDTCRFGEPTSSVSVLGCGKALEEIAAKLQKQPDEFYRPRVFPYQYCNRWDEKSLEIQTG